MKNSVEIIDELNTTSLLDGECLLIAIIVAVQ